MSSAACPACASTEARDWETAVSPPVRLCDRCGSLFFDRPIPPHDYETYYPYLEAFDADRGRWELKARSRQNAAKLRELERYGAKGRKLLDFGAGPGYFVRGAMDAGWDAEGAETSSPAIEFGRQVFGVRYVDLNDAPDRAYDVITCFHVLEHMVEPQQLLGAFRRKLKDGGVLMIQVPNRESLSGVISWRLRKWLGRPRPRLGCVYFPEHLTGFSSAGLKACAERAGFSASSIRQISPGDAKYDPTLFRNYFTTPEGRLKLQPGALLQKLVRGGLDQFGKASSQGDWIAAVFVAN
jgi:SAM-dependent methyltransferase